jgi:hypothetical protein
MSDKLDRLIARATERVEKDKFVETMEREQADKEREEKEAAAFKGHVDRGLGAEIMEALDGVTFRKFQHHEMAFTHQGRSFRLQQATGPLVELQETSNGGYSPLGNQFSLTNPDSKTTFLYALGQAIKNPMR